jgi:hypothetical protein
VSAAEPSRAPAAADTLGSWLAHVEGYPQGGRIPRHVHDQDQLALILGSAAVIETDESYVVHPLSRALWLPAGVRHAVYSARPFHLHSLYFSAGSVRSAAAPQVLGLELAVWRRHSRLLTSLMLLAEGKSIAEVAHAVGYDSTAAFGTAFRQCFGMTPKAYAAGR